MITFQIWKYYKKFLFFKKMSFVKSSFLVEISTKLLIPLLEPLTHNEFTIKDSFSFAKEIRTYDCSLYMTSLDVESLFTNIPLNETINNCVSDLHSKNLYHGKLSKRDLFKLLETTTSKSSFFFNYLLYMGSPLGPTLSNVSLCHYEKECLDNCPIHFKHVMYKRYVDDIFLLFSSKEHLQFFVDYMNKQHKCLKFTSEAENDTLSCFYTLKLPVINSNLKYLFIENQLSMVYLRTIWIKHIRSH